MTRQAHGCWSAPSPSRQGHRLQPLRQAAALYAPPSHRRFWLQTAHFWERLGRRFEPRLMAFLLTRCRTRDDAEDAFQQTFAAVWTCLHQYDPSRPPAPWLFTIAARIAMKEAKRNDRRRRRERIVARDEKWSSTSDAMIPPEAGAGNIWTIAARSLSQESYSALWLRYAEEMEPAQIAAVLGKRSGAVRVMLHRARLRLLELVEQDQGVDLRRTTAMEAAS